MNSHQAGGAVPHTTGRQGLPSVLILNEHTCVAPFKKLKKGGPFFLKEFVSTPQEASKAISAHFCRDPGHHTHTQKAGSEAQRPRLASGNCPFGAGRGAPPGLRRVACLAASAVRCSGGLRRAAAAEDGALRDFSRGGGSRDCQKLFQVPFFSSLHANGQLPSAPSLFIKQCLFQRVQMKHMGSRWRLQGFNWCSCHGTSSSSGP